MSSVFAVIIRTHFIVMCHTTKPPNDLFRLMADHIITRAYPAELQSQHTVRFNSNNMLKLYYFYHQNALQVFLKRGCFYAKKQKSLLYMSGFNVSSIQCTDEDYST